ncbi:hypothetical protein EWM64_g6320 [Hericium alpestre]|uniref:Uncharacterized protein n=1 Tax=Hericium alpestre TaxID=135208 RepID=A0A4Y9ZSZ8_9AGAM|nr:hypothetical protein EWM64_g6320 [Hericium alpestre]
MPHLEKLTLAGTPDRCAGIMQCLHLPIFTQLSLKLSNADEVERAVKFANILSCIRDHARASPSLNPLRTLWVSNSEDKGAITLRAWVGSCFPGQRKSFEYIEQTASPHVKIEFRRSMLVDGTTLLDAIRAFITPDLRAFCSEVSTLYAEISPRAWKTILNVSPQVQNVRIGDTSAISFCEALAIPAKNGAELMLPNLKFLELRNVHFGLSTVISDGSLSDLLPQWLAERQSQITLPRLVISGCHIEEECVDTLKELVDVVWDGDCGEYDSDWCSVFSVESDDDGANASYSEEDPEIVQLGRDVVEGRPVD